MTSQAIGHLLRRAGADQTVWAVRGEFFLHQANVLDLLASSVDGGEHLRAEARVYREQGRRILGPV